MSGGLRLVGDIGGTSVRFALVADGKRAARLRVFASDDFATLADALEAYLAAEGVRPHVAALSIASPVTGDSVALTNHPWSFSIAALKARLGLERLLVVNDFTANALAMPHLEPGERAQVGGGGAVAAAPIAVLGPGTGLGVSGLVPGDCGWVALAGEGGHRTMPAADERESAVLARMRRRFDHVSAERVLSGPGLVNLYHALAELDGTPAQSYTAAQIADRHVGEADPLVRASVDMFCAMLGTVAGDLALTLGARGGVFIAGGIVPRLGATFAASRFRARFEDKGRFRDYLATIPTFVVTCAIPAFLGLGALLAREG